MAPQFEMEVEDLFSINFFLIPRLVLLWLRETPNSVSPLQFIQSESGRRGLIAFSVGKSAI